MVTESDEAQSVRVKDIVDGAKLVMTNNERAHRKVNRLGRPVKIESVIDLNNDDDYDDDDDYNEDAADDDDDDDESDRHPKQQRCVTRSMNKLLTCDIRSPELATNKLDRNLWESAPINVVRGEMVNLIVQYEDRNIAYMENSTGDRRWIPKDSITGDDADSSPAHLITPKKFRKPPFQRSAAFDKLISISHVTHKSLSLDMIDEEDGGDGGEEEDIYDDLEYDEADMLDEEDEDEGPELDLDEKLVEENINDQSSFNKLPEIDSLFHQDNIRYLESQHFDVELIKKVYETCREHENASSSNPLSVFPLFMYNGQASNLTDVISMMKQIEILLKKAS
jgi:hypothetical protein